MILVEGEKYACIQCIRGHRSSTCQHTERPLVQVRSRGRPSNDSGPRIAVFTENNNEKLAPKETIEKKSCSSSITNNNISNPCQSGKIKKHGNCCAGKSKCCPTKALATDGKVIVARASKKRLVDVSNGVLKIVGPIKNEPMISSYSLNPTKRFFNNKEFKKENVEEKCCPNCKTAPTDSKDFEEKCGIIKFEPVNKPNPPKIKKVNNNAISNFYSSNFYELMSEHISCSCEDDNCACESCLIHGNYNPMNINNLSFKENSFKEFDANMVNKINSLESQLLDSPVPTSPTVPIPISLPNNELINNKGSSDKDKDLRSSFEINEKVLYDLVFANSCTIPGSCGCDDNCTCEGCVDHNKSQNSHL